MSRREFLVCPSANNPLVLDEVREVTRVVLIAQGKRASFMRLDKGLFSSECNVCVLIKQSLEDFGRGSSQFNDLINVLRLEFHGATMLR